MELAELKTFVAVVAEHSFSLAAIKLCRTQPAVSQAIRRLEEDLGERLFDRSAKHPTLTQAGDALLPEAIRLLRMADEAAATIRQLSQRNRAVLRIGGDEAAAHVLLPALKFFLAKQPHVSIEFRRVADLDTLGEVGAGTIDIGVTTRERVPAPLSSVQVPVLSAGFCVLLPTRHPFASRREVPMTILRSARLVTLAGVPLPTPVSTGATTDSALPPGSFLIMPGVDSLKQAVANGLGTGIVPRAVSSLTADAGLVAIPLSGSRAASALTLVYRDNDGQPNAVEDFFEAVRSTGEDRASRKAPFAMRSSK
jgi:DNA-binding transcriptional LysR family regulator